MKILHINKFPRRYVGGIEYHTETLISELVKFDIINEVKLLVSNTVFRFDRELMGKFEEIRLRCLGRMASTPISLGFLWWFRRFRDMDLFHFHHPYPIAVVLFLLSGIRMKYVVTYHTDIVRQRILGMLYRPFLNRFLKGAHAIIVTSPNMIDYSQVLLPYRSKCRVIPLGISVDRFLRKPNHARIDELRRQSGRYHVRLLFVGRLVSYKGVEVLLKAMTKVDGYLWIVGQGVLQSPLRQMTAELNIGDKVRFVGYANDEDLVDYYHACDIFVLPSVTPVEAYGLVQVEAQVCKRPVVSSRLPTGVTFVNLDHETGLTFETGNPDDLAEKINILGDNADLRNKYGEQGYSRATVKFTSTAMARKTVELYHNILNT